MAVSYVIGLDFGSDSVRAILVDSSDGTTLAASVCDYPRWKQGLYSDASESRFRHHPSDYIEAMTQAVRKVISACDDPKRITALSVDTTGSTPCLVDDKLVPLSLKPEFKDNPDAMFVLWKDHTSEKEAKEITEKCSARTPNYAAHLGGNYSPECYWSKILHILRRSPDIRAEAWSAIELCDWIPIILTGCDDLKDVKASNCAACAKHFWGKQWGGYPPESFFNYVDPLLLPILRHQTDKKYTCDCAAGHLCPKWASSLGLSENVLVGVGNIDSHSGAVGGGVAYKTTVMNLGTSACYMSVVPSEIMGGRFVDGVFGQVDDGILKGMDGFEVGLSAFGDLFAWLKRFLGWTLRTFVSDNAEELEKQILERLTEEASELVLKEDSPIATDFFNGRRCPSPDGSLTGTLAQMRISTTPAEVFRALVEATAFATKNILDYMEAEGVPSDRLVAIGGVSQKSPFVMQMLSDVTGRVIEVSSSKHAGALGSAIHASVIAGVYKDVKSAQDKMCQPILRKYTPAAKNDIILLRYKKYLDIAHFTENN
ncbi:MAG: ribulokinase [Bacteroidales bacterium]